MKLKVIRFGILVTLVLGLFAAPGEPGDFDHGHSLYAQVLHRFVHGGLVDYAALRSDPKDLNAYLNSLADVSESEFHDWSKPEQMAFLINLYNAETLQLIVDHYPVESIKEIGGLLKGPWDEPVVRLFGNTITLNNLEHDILRARYADARIHFAIVCASVSCPRLRGEPYVASRLNRQLYDQARAFLGAPEKNRIDRDARVVYLSPIFKWFEKDFREQSGSVLSFVRSYSLPDTARELEKGAYEVRYTDYDWSLNDFARQSRTSALVADGSSSRKGTIAAHAN